MACCSSGGYGVRSLPSQVMVECSLPPVGKRRFRWKASATEKLHGHLMDGYFGDVSRTAVGQEWKATGTMTFLSEEERRYSPTKKAGRSATQLHQSDEGRCKRWYHFNSYNLHQLLAGDS